MQAPAARTSSPRANASIVPPIHPGITHGHEGAVNGVITTEHGGALAFGDVYRLSSARGTKMTTTPMMSYTVDASGGG